MALAKIKLDEVDTKATPVLADSFLLSDSEDGGRGKLATGTAIEEMITTGDTLTTALAGKAPIASPAFTGTPTAPTAAKGTATTQIASTGYVYSNYKQTCSYTQGGSTTVDPAEPGKLYSFTGAGTLVLPVASTVPDGTIIDVFCQATTATVTISSATRILSMAGATSYTFSLAGYGNTVRFQSIDAGSGYYWMVLFDPVRAIELAKASPALTGTPTAPTAAPGTNTTQLATTAFVQAATASAIYDLPVTRSGLVSSGTDSIIFETSNAIAAEWYDTTHILNVSFFARNESGVSNNTTFKLQLYDEGTSTAHTIASITADTMDYKLLQASIYRTSSSSVNCNVQYGVVSGSGYVSLAVGSYKLRVVCTSTLSTVFGSAQVRFTK